MIKFVILIALLVICACESDEEYSYIDPVIDMLLNGVSGETTEDIHDEEAALVGSIWKCGNCTDLGEAKLVHSELNLADADTDEQEVEVWVLGQHWRENPFAADSIWISLVVSGLRCVTVTSAQPGAVRKLLGTCEGSSVTLSVSPSQNYTILVYA